MQVGISPRAPANTADWVGGQVIKAEPRILSQHKETFPSPSREIYHFRPNNSYNTGCWSKMCFGGKKNKDPEPQEAAKLTIIHTPPPPEHIEKFPSPVTQLDTRISTHDQGLLSARSFTAHSLPPPDRPWTPTHNKRSSRGTALIERNRLSDIDPHEVQRASHGDLGENIVTFPSTRC